MLRKRLLCLLFLLLPVGALANSLPEKLQSDFSPLDGIIVLATPGQILIDRDQSSNVAVGDLFSVITPGAPIIHPTSGTTLGISQSVNSWLRVGSVREGYSETTLVSGGLAVKAGEKVRRFAEVEAIFVDAAGRAGDLYPRLQKGLPQLRWLGYFTGASALPPLTLTPRLTFTVVANALEIREERSGLLRRYPLEVPAALPAVLPSLPASTAGYWNGPAQAGVARGVEIADLDGDGRNETVIATLHGLEVGRFSGQEYQQLAAIDLGLSHNLLAVDAFDSDGDGRPELWVTAHRDADLDSMVLLWDGEKKIGKVAEHLNWWLRGLTLPGRGRTLLAQKMEGADFSGPIMAIALKNRKVVTIDAALPGNLSLYGLALLGSKEEPLTVQLNPFDKLNVRSVKGEVLQEGEETYGGAEAFIPRVDPQRVGSEPDIRHVYPPPRFEVVGKNYLLAPANLGSRTFARQRTFKESRLDLLHWDGAFLRPVITGRVETGYLADYRYADLDNDGVKELVSLIVTARPSLTAKGRYLIVVQETVLPE